MSLSNINPSIYVVQPNQNSQSHSIIDCSNIDIDITSIYNNQSLQYDTSIQLGENPINLTLDVTQANTNPNTLDAFIYEGNYNNFHAFDLVTNSGNYVFSNADGTINYGTNKDFLTLNNNQLYITANLRYTSYVSGLYTTYLKLNNTIIQFNIFILQIIPKIIYCNLNNLFTALSTNILDIVHMLSNNINYINIQLVNLHSNYFGPPVTFKFCDINGNNESSQFGPFKIENSTISIESSPTIGLVATYIKAITETNSIFTIKKINIRFAENVLSNTVVSDISNIDPATFKAFLVNNYPLQKYEVPYSVIETLISDVSNKVTPTTTVTLIPFQSNSTFEIQESEISELENGNILYFVGSTNDTLNISLTGNVYPLTLTETGISYDSINYQLNEIVRLNGVLFMVKLIGSIGLQMLGKDNFFVNSPFVVNQNGKLYTQSIIDNYQYEYIMSINMSNVWNNDMNQLFTSRFFQQNLNDIDLYNINLTANYLAISDLLSHDVITMNSPNNDIINKAAYSTIMQEPTKAGLRFLEIIATKIFGHAKARAAISNDTTYYLPYTSPNSIINQLVSGINQALNEKRNDIFNAYVAYDRIQDNTTNDVENIVNFNFSNTEWNFPMYFVSTLISTNMESLIEVNNGPNVGGTQLMNGQINVPILLRFYK